MWQFKKQKEDRMLFPKILTRSGTIQGIQGKQLRVCLISAIVSGSTVVTPDPAATFALALALAVFFGAGRDPAWLGHIKSTHTYVFICIYTYTTYIFQKLGNV